MECQKLNPRQCIIKTEAVGPIPLHVNCDCSQIVSRTSPTLRVTAFTQSRRERSDLPLPSMTA